MSSRLELASDVSHPPVFWLLLIQI